MRSTIFTTALLFGFAAAQIEIPDGVEIPDGIEIPDNVEIPTELPSEVPDWAQEIVSDIASGVAPQASATASSPASAATSSSTANSDTLPGLVDQLPRCAVSCLVSAASDIGCSSTDFQCLCSSATNLATSIGPCVLLSSGCGTDDARRAGEIAPQICDKVNNNPDASEVASASAIVAGAAATADGASPSATNSDDDSAAVRNGLGMGVAGAAVLMAFVL
ncbi:hypothetical protein ACHAQA_003039 [Verticillium albo-atrum]